MHYITTRKWLVLGAVAVSVSCSSMSVSASGDSRVFYRATDGKQDSVYVLSMKRAELNRIIKRKVYLWDSLRKCKETPKMVFSDPLFTGEKVSLQVKSDCTLEVQNVFGTLSCVSNVIDANNVKVLFQEDASIGYGAEYMTAYERQYTERHCKVK